MPEITFTPYVEGEPYDAASLNDRFLPVEAGLNQILITNMGTAGLGQDQTPSLAGYTERNVNPRSPHLISIEGLSSSTGPPDENAPGDKGRTAIAHDFNPATANLAVFPAEWPVGVLAPDPVTANPAKWETVRVGKGNSTLTEGNLEVYFHTTGGIPIGAVSFAYPLHLRRANAVTWDETFAQGLVVMANINLRGINHTPGEEETHYRKYACFSVQLLTYEPGWVPGQPGDPQWYIIPRTIRYVSEKTIPPDGFFQAAGVPVPDPEWLGPGVDTTAGSPPQTDYASVDGARDSWIDVPIRTVIRREDIMAIGYLADDDLPPLLGVRIAVGIWAVKVGPIQDGSYEQATGLYAGRPADNDGLIKVFIRQGNMSIFPLHASRDKTVFYP